MASIVESARRALRRTVAWRPLLAAANTCTIIAIATTIELTGGLPSQLAHLYYLPVVTSALTLSARQRLAIAMLAGLMVSPAIDVLHEALNQPVFFTDPSPFNLGPTGWVLRPLAFFAVSVLAGSLVREREEKETETHKSEARGEELKVLSLIDKLILAGTPEEEALREVARLTHEFMGSYTAGVFSPSPDGSREVTFRGYRRDASGPVYEVDEHLPSAEGVSGWALMHGRTATSSNVLADNRYQVLAEMARNEGWRSAAATPIVLDGEILGALAIIFREERAFPPEELDALEHLADQAAVAVGNARQRTTLKRMALDTATVLTNVIESRDPYTGDHCTRLVDYAGLIGERLRLDSRDIDLVKLAAALHDVGKIAVPDVILKKPDKLTPDEYALIKQHCYVDGQICKKVPFLEPVYSMVYHHHEHYDGHGYPDGIAGERIPLGSRIIAVVDAYDAMTSDRPYRRALAHETAVSILKDGAGRQWDPAILQCFLEGLRETSGGLLVA